MVLHHPNGDNTNTFFPNKTKKSSLAVTKTPTNIFLWLNSALLKNPRKVNNLFGITPYLDSGIVSPLRLRLVKRVCVFRCNLPPVLLAEWSGSFTCRCGNTGMERTPNKSHHTKLTLEKKILSPLLPGFELTTFRSRVRCSYQQTIPAPYVFLMTAVILLSGTGDDTRVTTSWYRYLVI